MTPAVFLDRDGTLIDDPGFLSDPEAVHLLPGVPAALRRLQQAGYRLVVVSNQSGIGRGLLTVAQVDAVHRELDRQLVAEGVTIDAMLYCPHRPDEGCDCRKPGTALHRRAAVSLDLDLARSWCIGDRPGDVDAAASLGAGAILVLTGEGAMHREAAEARGVAVADDLARATDLVLN